VPRVSRGEFLGFLAAGGIAALAGMRSVSSPRAFNNFDNQATAQVSGSWKTGPKALNHPVHLALLPSGKVLYVAGSGFHRPSASGPFKAGIWNPTTNAQKEYLLDEDIWCSGHALLPSGNVLFVGGTLKYAKDSPNRLWWGLNSTYEFSFQTETFLNRPAMKHGRWYPTVVCLANGKIQVVDGYDEFGYNNLLTEIYDPVNKTWTISYAPNSSDTYCVGCGPDGCANVEGAGEICYGGTNNGVAPLVDPYPRMHLLPSGMVACVGQDPIRYLWDPSTGSWYEAGTGIERSFGTSVLLPLQNTTTEKGKILICGGSDDPSFPAIAKKSAEILEQSDFKLVSKFAPSMTFPRRYCNPVILPDGKVLIIGGTRENNDKSLAVYKPEMFDPITKKWTILPPHSVPRIYHSGALLLMDGRVYVAGSSYSPYSYELRTEIFSPTYVFEQRPKISAISATATYGKEFEITTLNASTIKSVSMVRFSSTTHHYNTDQRLLWLQIISKTGNIIKVSSPRNSRLAPPGYYMVHILNWSGIPSKAATMQVL